MRARRAVIPTVTMVALAFSLVVLIQALRVVDASDPVTILSSILSQPRDGYPETVATVNGAPISGEALALGVNVRSHQAPDALPSDLAEIALGDLIASELLLQEAKSQDLWPTESEIDNEIARYKAMHAQLVEGSDAKNTFDEILRLQNLDIATIASDPRFREVAARWTAKRNLEDSLRATLPPADQADTNIVKQILFDHTVELWESADIDIMVSVYPALPQPEPDGFITPVQDESDSLTP